MRAFWPVSEAAQADYEALRALALAGEGLPGVAARRFERRGLVGLITWPRTDPLFTAAVAGAARPPWTPHADPRLEALAAVYAFILALCPESAQLASVHR